MTNKSLQDMDRAVWTRAPESWIQELDEWRNRQAMPTTRAAAIRYLVELGLKYEAACKWLMEGSEK